MTKVEIANAVNEWFNIENYSVLQNLTVEQLFQEIENRIVVYRMEQNRAELSPENLSRHQNYYEELMVVFLFIQTAQNGMSGIKLLCHYSKAPAPRESEQVGGR